MAKVNVQTQDFDIGAETAALTAGHTNIGGIGCFIGTVRAAPPDQRAITALTLEHYPAMTQRALEKIAAEAERRWSLLGCTVIHRHGRLELGANIVLVIAAAAHRQAALDAASFLIDWLKTKAPFWKQEHFLDGATTWVEAKSTDADAAARWSD
ncbi:MAG: molybdenum cofactor biosynthesis protein MoaE [Acetobacteraceae bacterium]|nr:molybdenum cofactor biosynthesis protein MoaE [Acetobacteraceae bacterium]MSP31044.1 molybdenum cofactor biosynthesis protein MoaE [Acetobacteraceae bacterium]